MMPLPLRAATSGFRGSKCLPIASNQRPSKVAVPEVLLKVVPPAPSKPAVRHDDLLVMTSSQPSARHDDVINTYRPLRHCATLPTHG